jgi:uncharacterized metal-binding protein
MGCSCNAPENSYSSINVQISGTNKRCPAGEQRGNENKSALKIPVLSCEGACIKGELARLIANKIAKKGGYARGCHGELLTVPDSSLAKWIKNAAKTVIIDGCSLKCHYRIFENILQKNKIISIDALSYHKSFADEFDIDCVPDSEKERIAAIAAEKIFGDLNKLDNCMCEEKPEEIMRTLSLEEDSLVSLGAAIGANCVPCTVYYLKQSKTSALGEAKIKAAIEAAIKVKNTPAEHILSVVEKIVNGTDDTGVANDNSCSTNMCSTDANSTNSCSTNACSCEQ